jgi:lipopolysaccharide/colanic/teichoic acid biosynthesis glycosyltransferase
LLTLPRILEILLASAAFLLTLPVFVIAILVSSLFIGFPPFYRSGRRGLGGAEYMHWKVRSMKKGRETGRVFFEAHRLNSWGRLLRRFHLDELPELCHIISGRMSIIGPRPLPSSLLEGLDTTLRDTVRPGWTGPAQIILLRRGRLDKRLQIKLDNHYVRRRSTIYDVRILLGTIRAALTGRRQDMNPSSTPDRIEFGKGRGFSSVPSDDVDDEVADSCNDDYCPTGRDVQEPRSE